MKGIGCSSCRNCGTRTKCDPFRNKLRTYSGVRFTADGFDCALPVCIDSHNTCSFGCLYCFSNYLMRDPQKKATYSANAFKTGQWSLRSLERMLSGDAEGQLGRFYQALCEVGPDKRRCPVQWGGLGDPFDNIERHQGWGLQAMEIFEKYEQPVRVSTKGGPVLQEKQYLAAFSRRPDLYWVAWSCISIDDEKLAEVDHGAPSATDRLKAMKALTNLGVKCSLRFRPILPGISDRTPRHPHAWRDLLRATKDAGACAVSMEFAFVPRAQPPHIRARWKQIEKAANAPLTQFYRRTSRSGECLRSSRAWKEDLTFAIHEEVKSLGMNFGISDPHWKELNDFGCCCGISPDDPVFGGWQRKNATNALVRARQSYDEGQKLLVSAKDGIPQWARRTMIREMVCLSGPNLVYKKNQTTWADKLQQVWNDTKSARGPLYYFEGVLWPVGKTKDGDIQYEYRPPKRRDQSKKVPYLHV